MKIPPGLERGADRRKAAGQRRPASNLEVSDGVTRDDGSARQFSVIHVEEGTSVAILGWRVHHLGGPRRLPFSPLATILSASSRRGRCKSNASRSDTARRIDRLERAKHNQHRRWSLDTFVALTVPTISSLACCAASGLCPWARRGGRRRGPGDANAPAIRLAHPQPPPSPGGDGWP
jgi:hypothetical protein